MVEEELTDRASGKGKHGGWFFLEDFSARQYDFPIIVQLLPEVEVVP